jgi:hypothetical protein
MQMNERPAPLDFNEDPPDNMYEAVSRVLRHFGDQGATMEEVCGMFQRNCPQWKPVSVSPVLTLLIRAGCAREERNFGTRRIYHMKLVTHVEMDDIRALQREAKEKGMRERIAAELPTRSAPVLGKDMAVVVQGAKMMLAIGKNNTIVIEAREARELYEQLKALFG